MPTPTRDGKGTRTVKVTATLILVTFLLLALVPATAIAAGPGSGGNGGNGPGPGGPDREVDVDVEPKRARIRSTVQGSDGGQGGGDALDYEIEAGEGLTVQMQYRNQAEAQAANVQMKVTFQRMVEYEDKDGNGQLGPGDEVVTTYDLEGTGWDDLEHVDETAEDGRMMHRITARTSDGVFAMVTRTTETRAQTSSGEVSPNLMKIDLVVEDFPWTRTTTRLALEAKVEAHGPVTTVSDPARRAYMVEGESGIESDVDGDVGFYTWMHSYQLDGEEGQVRAQVTGDGDGTRLTFNYAQGDSIVHDPKLGVPLVDEGLFDVMERLLPYLAVMGLSAMVIGAAVYIRKRGD